MFGIINSGYFRKIRRIVKNLKDDRFVRHKSTHSAGIQFRRSADQAVRAANEITASRSWACVRLPWSRHSRARLVDARTWKSSALCGGYGQQYEGGAGPSGVI